MQTEPWSAVPLILSNVTAIPFYLVELSISNLDPPQVAIVNIL